MKKVVFVAIADANGVRDGDEGYEIFVDGVKVDELRGDENDIGDLPKTFWRALDVEVYHDYSSKEVVNDLLRSKG